MPTEPAGAKPQRRGRDITEAGRIAAIIAGLLTGGGGVWYARGAVAPPTAVDVEARHGVAVLKAEIAGELRLIRQQQEVTAGVVKDMNDEMKLVLRELRRR
jgi:hypothetical protein